MAVKKIKREELQEKIDQGGVTLVETLPLEHYKEAHLPGALHLPHDEVEERATELLPDKSAEVVTYCADASCPASKRAAERLIELGYTNVAEYEEGKPDWQEAGLPMESGMPT